MHPLTLECNRPELFVDSALIDKTEGAIGLELQKPVEREIAIAHDAPWEGNLCAYHTVFKDPDGYRMYYRGAQGNLKTSCTCLAVSDDGIRWTKPELGLHVFEGSRQNNIVALGRGAGAGNFAPFRDANPAADPNAAYKALSSMRLKAWNTFGLRAHASPDGLRWTPLQEDPVLTDGHFDSLNVPFWHPEQKVYRAYYRDFIDRDGTFAPDGTPSGIRAIKTATSADFVHWTQGVFVDFPGASQSHLYTSGIHPYVRAPHILIGFPMRFVKIPNPVHPIEGVCDAVFMSSRDGVTFNRWDEAVVRPGFRERRWVHRNNMASCGVLETPADDPECPAELSVYTTEGYGTGDALSDKQQRVHSGPCHVRMRRHTYRLDGFVALHAPLVGGEIITHPLRISTPADGPLRLRLNASTSAAGAIRVGLLDAAGGPIEGYGLDDGPPLRGDGIDLPVAWNDRQHLPDVGDQPFRLRIALHDADLYSLTINETAR